MQTSESIAKIAEALSKAQGAFTHAVKDSVNPHFRNRYADLESIWDAIRAPLSANGLAVVQSPFADSHTEVTITTRLIHSSGEWIESDTIIPVTKRDAQGVGSAITYGRRYGLSALVGITQGDDDGEGAVGRISTVKVAGKAHPVAPAVQKEEDISQDYQTPQAFSVELGILRIHEAKTLDELRDIWTDISSVASTSQLRTLSSAKDHAKSKLSAEPSRTKALVKSAVKKAAKEPPVLPGEPETDDEIPFDFVEPKELL